MKLEIPNIWHEKAMEQLLKPNPFLGVMQATCPKHEARFTWKFWVKTRYCKHCFLEMKR